jgi:glycosyltransferase involved in cell wall biosynthesis
MKYADNLQRSENLDPSQTEVELSVIIPCLNEADTLGICIETAKRALASAGVTGEIIIADNGSTDGSPEIAHRAGAIVVHVPNKGYGSALMGGIEQARGKYVLMGDADASYDFGELSKFLDKLREGYSLVQGCRLSSGGGKVMPGAMPFLHRWWGNPMFSYFARMMFHAPIHDVNCGLRAFSKDLYRKLDQRCTGMEFAVEMVLKASLREAKIAEVPITLHPDQRKNRSPHLRTFRDGWRTLRFYLMSSPKWLFLYPGALLIALGIIGYALALPGMVIGGVGFDVHTLLLASLGILAGYQAILFSVSAKTFAITEGLLPADRRFLTLFKFFTLERGIAAGATACVFGFVLVLLAVNYWRMAHFGALDSHVTLRLVVPGVLLLMLGIQTIFGSFFLSILGLRHK